MENRPSMAALLIRAGARVLLPDWFKEQNPEAQALYEEQAKKLAGGAGSAADLRKTHRAAALAALAQHQKSYGRKIGGQLKDFWSADPWKFEGARLDVKIASVRKRSCSLSLVPPSWSALADLFDDAVVGKSGDWKQAGDFIPLFQAEDEGFIVAWVAAPHRVGWFEEATWRAAGKGYADGVFLLADSLDGFLATLKPAKKPRTEFHAAWSDS
jgi:hypothetical protein